MFLIGQCVAQSKSSGLYGLEFVTHSIESVRDASGEERLNSV